MKGYSVIYIMSDVRSGSTLLEYMLSQNKSVVSLGELHHVDSYFSEGYWGKRWGYNCSCGNKLSECEFWNNIISDENKDEIKEITLRYHRKSKWKISFNPQYKQDVNFRRRTDILRLIYNKSLEVSGADTVIDSSKHEHQILAGVDHVDIKTNVIYLKRDIRAVVLSKLKWQKKIGIQSTNKYVMLFMSAILRVRQNIAYSRIHKENRIKLSYSNVASCPQETLDQIKDKFLLSKMNAPKFFERENTHTVGGTPNRKGKKPIKLDDGWTIESKRDWFFHTIGAVINRI